MEAVLHDVDGQVHVAVSPVSDPLADLQRKPRQVPLLRPRRDRARPRGGGGGTVTTASTGRRKHMIGKLIKAALIAAVLALIVQSLPDIKRYLELREM